jgi:hypothetical protein
LGVAAESRKYFVVLLLILLLMMKRNWGNRESVKALPLRKNVETPTVNMSKSEIYASALILLP